MRPRRWGGLQAGTRPLLVFVVLRGSRLVAFCPRAQVGCPSRRYRRQWMSIRRRRAPARILLTPCRRSRPSTIRASPHPPHRRAERGQVREPDRSRSLGPALHPHLPGRQLVGRLDRHMQLVIAAPGSSTLTRTSPTSTSGQRVRSNPTGGLLHVHGFSTLNSGRGPRTPRTLRSPHHPAQTRGVSLVVKARRRSRRPPPVLRAAWGPSWAGWRSHSLPRQ